MSDIDSVSSHSSDSGGGEDLAHLIATRAVPEREGLPQTYRMRAEPHYLDQLESPPPPVVRLIATAQIDCADPATADRVDPLAKSIATHGVLQPLLVRRHEGRYKLIAGRKRLAAAIAAGVAAVPCLMHDVDREGAATIAAADNIRAELPAPPAAEADVFAPVLQAVYSDVGTILTSAPLLKSWRPRGLPQQVSTDLVQAQAWRASWLLSCIPGMSDSSRVVPLGVILQRVADGFEPYARLAGLQLECSATGSAAVWKLPEDLTTAAIAGGVFATLAWLEGTAQPRIEVRADAPHGLKIEIAQRMVRVPPQAATLSVEQCAGRPDEVVPALALRTARAVAALHDGAAELTLIPGVGSVLQITFAQAHKTA